MNIIMHETTPLCILGHVLHAFVTLKFTPICLLGLIGDVAEWSVLQLFKVLPVVGVLSNVFFFLRTTISVYVETFFARFW